MTKFSKSIALIMALLFCAAAFAGCHKSGDNPGQTTEPTSAPTEQNSADSSAEPTELPEYMWTPDPALFVLGEDGYFEDDFLTAYWPSFLQYVGHYLSNSAQYLGIPEGSTKKVGFSYTTDEGGSFEDELEGHTFDSYQNYIQEQINSYFYLEEFSYITIDGHRAVKALYNYNPPDEPEHYTRLLQYSINVNGWILGLCFSTQMDAFPEECVTCINTIHFKDGY